MPYKLNELLNEVTVSDSSGNVLTTLSDYSTYPYFTTEAYPYTTTVSNTTEPITYIDGASLGTLDTTGYINTGITGTSAWAPVENFPNHLDISPNGEFLIYDTPFGSSHVLYQKNGNNKFINIKVEQARSKSQEEIIWVYNQLSRFISNCKIKYDNKTKEFRIDG